VECASIHAFDLPVEIAEMNHTHLTRGERYQIYALMKAGHKQIEHEDVAKKLYADFYLAHPYSSWECGKNEYTNGLIRQFIPKNRDFTTLT
jgi:IS30 family transposase